MLDIQEINDEVLQILLDYSKDIDENFCFTLRKSNRYGRLEEGFWFYGNEECLAVSFWSGMDWKNKTPNIFFGISQTGRTYLEITVSDSEVKNGLVEKYLISQLGEIQKSGNKYVKIYNEEGHFNYMDSLKKFINPGGDRWIIDKEIEQNLERFEKADEHGGISFINKNEFEDRLNYILKYREIKLSGEIQRPVKIKSMIIEGYGPIKEVELKDISFDNQWIFLTGLNGTGKSSVIKALGPALTQKELYEDENNPKVQYKVNFELYDQFGKVHHRFREGNSETGNRKSNLVKGFAAYGPVRLQTARKDIGEWQLKRALNKSKALDSLREENESYLLDISTHIKHWNQKAKHRKFIKKRKEFIQDVLRDIFESRFDVRFNKHDEIIYVEIDENGKELQKVPYHKLSTGLRGTISLIGDILIRLYEQQPDISDPSDLTGIVLIDEIDIHLHPILQRRLVKELSATFSKIQFIVTTHSPMPLLGAPIGSYLGIVTRNVKDGIKVNRLDDKIYLTDLLPQHILTSPIFGMEDITSEYRTKGKTVRTEASFAELSFAEKRKNKIRAFIDSEKEEQLIELFKNRGI